MPRADTLRRFQSGRAGIGNDQLNALEAAIDQVPQKRRPAGLVFLGALTDAQNLPKSLRIDSAGHQEGDIPHFARPAALHHDPASSTELSRRR